MGMKVWVVVHGCYSDASVSGVYSTREAARADATKFCTGPSARFDRATVQEYEVDVEDGGPWHEEMVENFDNDSPREDKSTRGTKLEND